MPWHKFNGLIRILQKCWFPPKTCHMIIRLNWKNYQEYYLSIYNETIYDPSKGAKRKIKLGECSRKKKRKRVKKIGERQNFPRGNAPNITDTSYVKRITLYVRTHLVFFNPFFRENFNIFEKILTWKIVFNKMRIGKLD